MDLSHMDIKGLYRVVDILDRDAFNRRRDELIGQVLLFYEDLHPRRGVIGEEDYWGGSAEFDDGRESFYFYGVKIEPVDEGRRPLW